jgi:hypothetical protein
MCGLDLIGSVWSRVMGSSGNGNEPLGNFLTS